MLNMHCYKLTFKGIVGGLVISRKVEIWKLPIVITLFHLGIQLEGAGVN